MKNFLNYKLLLVVIVLLAVFLRFNQLGNIPVGLTNDEAGVGWDAYSVLLTGKDQWNQFLPLHFMAFGDYPAPILRYLTVPSVFLFDLNAFSARFPSALFGVFSVIIIFFLVRKLFNEKAGLLASLLFAISPWAIGLSRVTIEPNIAITFFLLGLLLYIISLERAKFLIFSVICFVLVVYTYSAYVLFLPLVALALLIWNRKYVRKNLKIYIISAILFIILVIPNFVTKNTTIGVRFSQVGITNNVNSIGLINILNDERGACLKKYNPYICKVINNKIILFSSTFFKNYSSHFSINFLYNNGTPTQQSILPERGLNYAFGIIFFILGLVWIVRNKDKRGYFLIVLLLLSPIPDSLTGDGHYGRASIMIPFLIISEGVGLFYLLEIFSKVRNIFVRDALYLGSILLMFSAAAIFWINYTTYFKDYYSISSQYGYEDLMKNVYRQKNNYDKIYISRHLNDTKQYVYYLFYTKYDPSKYQNKEDMDYSIGSDGWISVNRIENIYFVQSPPSDKDLKSISLNRHVLIISNPVDFPKQVKPVFLVKDRLGNVIFKAVNFSDLLEYEKSQKLLRLKNANI